MPEGERLQKTLARAGFGSRRACEILISEGRVTIDGRVAELGNRVDPETQIICVECGTQEYVDFVPPDPAAAYCLACFSRRKRELQVSKNHKDRR